MDAYEGAMTFQIPCIDKKLPDHEMIVVQFPNGVGVRFEDAMGDEIEIGLDDEDDAWAFMATIMNRVTKRHEA